MVFAPRRRAHQAVEAAKRYIAEGYEWVVDLDLEKFFDRVNHDVLMGKLVQRVGDKRVLRVIRRYLQAGVMVHGVVQERWEGTPQGGHGNIYVKSKRAGERVFASIERFLNQRLKLRVNREKSAVGRYHERSFLGFGFTSGKTLKVKASEKSLERFKDRVREITRRSRGRSFPQMMGELMEYLRGWIGYYRLVETLSVLKDLDGCIRRRLRCYMAKQWIKNCYTRARNLVRLGVSPDQAWMVGMSRKGPWAMSNMKPLKVAVSNHFLAKNGFTSLIDQHQGLDKAI